MRLRDLNPLRLWSEGRFSYQRIPNHSPFDFQTYQWPGSARAGCAGRMTLTKLIGYAIAGIVVLALVGGGGYRHVRSHRPPPGAEGGPPPFHWQNYYRLDGYYNGVRMLVRPEEWVPENGYNLSIPAMVTEKERLEKEKASLPVEPPMDPVTYDPYPFKTKEYQREYAAVEECFLDEEGRVPAPDIYAYPGVPQYLSKPFYGDYKVLGLREDVCFERFGRFAPYGYGYEEHAGGLGLGNKSERAGAEKVFARSGYVDYSKVDWGMAQRRCREKNTARFEEKQAGGKKRVERHAYVLRTWTGYEYTNAQILSLRAMINELSLKSGGQYDVHLLVHVKNISIPIWASPEVYQETLRANVPREFWNMTTLWSERQMEMYYPEPFPDNFANMAGSSIHGVYRSAHFALQWFSQQHQEYDFFWNWEMDIRYTGHYWEFNDRIGEWGKSQPRKGLWERGRRFYIPERHGDWANFTQFVETETREVDIAANDLQRSGPVPIWGPYQDFPNTGMLPPPPETIPKTSYDEDAYEWGVGENADLLVFNPLFDPSLTNWVFSWDITGYNRTLPVPPRRAAIITVARLSKRLLNIMHEETWRMKHTMFPEMWPPAVCMHHGLKAVYVPHPVFFDRDWELGHMDQVFNYPTEIWDSPFGWGEHNLLGSSFYYNSGFSGALWRRWLGQKENGEGGAEQEKEGSGRMCLRPVLHHPIKHEKGPVE